MICYASGFKLTGTKSWRRAASMLLGQYGGNAQNPPAVLCECIRPSLPGRSFVQPDQSGAESLIVAMEAGDGLYRRILKAGIKQHCYIALQVFLDYFRGTYPRERYYRIPPEELVKLPEWPELNKRIKSSGSRYDLGKMLNHARSYRMRWPTFQLKVLTDTEGKVVLTREQAQGYMNLWDELFPEVVLWQAKIEDTLRRTRTLDNLQGFPRTFYGKLTDELIREAISFIPQSTVGCITQQAEIDFQDYIEESSKDWHFLNDKHDSFLSDVPDNDVEECTAVMRKCIEVELISSSGEKFRMKSGVSVGKNWGKYSEDNPNGMKEL